MKDFLAAFEGYFPWAVILILGLVFRGLLIGVVKAFGARVAAGSEVEVNAPGGSIGLGPLVADTEDAVNVAERQGSSIEVFGNPDQIEVAIQGTR
ncbi:hypothetical protein ACQP2F_14605 [Actinoplanes sp. CA-030573]|uniref:hypothetical protein n=1 Tax=Actinoplanes sp. CA-030573 TaxID=3239898 RepID=UPI003D8EDD06